MSTLPSILARLRRRCEIALVKTTLQILRPIEAFLEECSHMLEGRKQAHVELLLGQAVYRCYLQERTALQMQKLLTAHQLHSCREELIALSRENRQLRGRLQMYEYEEDAAQVNRRTLLGLHREKSSLSERNGQLKSELKRTDYLLRSVEHEIEGHPPKRPREEKRVTVSNNSISSGSTEIENVSVSSDSETGTVKVCTSVSSESFDSDSTWISKHQIMVHVSSSNISPKPD